MTRPLTFLCAAWLLGSFAAPAAQTAPAPVTQSAPTTDTLTAARADVERRLAAIVGHDSTKASIRYPFERQRAIREGRLPAPGGRGGQADPAPELARAEDQLKALEAGRDPLWRATGDHARHHYFAAADLIVPYRVYVPTTWDGRASLPVILMLHGGGATENTYMDQADKLLPRLAETHGYIVVSPLGLNPLGAYGNPLRLPAVFGQPAAAATQRAAVTPERRRELALSELDVITVLELVTNEYGADRARTYLAGHSMGSGGAWHLAARYPDRWRAVAPMSGPFVDEPTYPFDRLRGLPLLMTEGLKADPSLAGSRLMAAYMTQHGFTFEYAEVDGDHMGMVPMVWPSVFAFFNRYR